MRFKRPKRKLNLKRSEGMLEFRELGEDPCAIFFLVPDRDSLRWDKDHGLWAVNLLGNYPKGKSARTQTIASGYLAPAHQVTLVSVWAAVRKKGKLESVTVTLKLKERSPKKGSTLTVLFSKVLGIQSRKEVITLDVDIFGRNVTFELRVRFPRLPKEDD